MNAPSIQDHRAILAAVASGRGLTDDEVATICAIIDASERQGRRAAVIWVGLLFLILALLAVAEFAFGWRNKTVAGALIMLAFLPLVVVFSKRNMLRMAIERRLYCRSCRRPLRGFKVTRVRDERCCPHCSASDPLATRRDDG